MKNKNKKENPFQIKIEDMVVNFEFSETEKTLEECIVNILLEGENIE